MTIPLYPITPHLRGSQGTTDDTFMDKYNTDRILMSYVIVQEKINGINIGVNVGNNNECILINKDKLVQKEDYSLYPHIINLLNSDFISYLKIKNITLFGEYITDMEGCKRWIVFDAFDKKQYKFLKYCDLVALSEYLHLEVIPILYEGTLSSIDTIKNFITLSQFTKTKMEGIVMRIEKKGFLKERYKYVREGFVKK